MGAKGNLTSGVDPELELLPCESSDTCTWIETDKKKGADLTALCRVQSNGLLKGAICGEGNEGFMCSKCKKGYTKINGSCVICPGFNWGTLAFGVLTTLLSAFFLLHKSTGAAVVSEEEIAAIWAKVDVGTNPIPESCLHKGRTYNFQLPTVDQGSLNEEGVVKVFELTGVNMTGSNLTKLKKEEFDDEGENGVMKIGDFIRYRGAGQPTSGLGIAVFFIQTLALIAKDASFFGAADALNLDAEQAAGACVSPLG